jgi:hypothetical protein
VVFAARHSFARYCRLTLFNLSIGPALVIFPFLFYFGVRNSALLGPLFSSHILSHPLLRPTT